MTGLSLLAAQAGVLLRKRAAAPDDPSPILQRPMRQGWQWKALNQEEARNEDNWLPRMMTSESTPVAETLASPLKQSLIGALLGAGAGGVAGHYAGQGLGTDPTMSAGVGAGLGGLIGGVHTYRQRRKKNDEVAHAMRFLPPGATVGEVEALHKLQGKQGSDDEQQGALTTLGQNAMMGGGAATVAGYGGHVLGNEYLDRRFGSGAVGDLAHGARTAARTVAGQHPYSRMTPRNKLDWAMLGRHKGRAFGRAGLAGLLGGVPLWAAGNALDWLGGTKKPPQQVETPPSSSAPPAPVAQAPGPKPTESVSAPPPAPMPLAAQSAPAADSEAIPLRRRLQQSATSALGRLSEGIAKRFYRHNVPEAPAAP